MKQAEEHLLSNAVQCKASLQPFQPRREATGMLLVQHKEAAAEQGANSTPVRFNIQRASLWSIACQMAATSGGALTHDPPGELALELCCHVIMLLLHV